MVEWLAMGGYAIFVWPAYALAAAVLIFNIWAPQRRFRRLKNELGLNETPDHETQA